MKALRITDYGQISMESVNRPVPGEGEVLVKVAAASINPVDWKIANGDLAVLVNQPLPLTLGWDMAGEVLKLGANVNAFNVGDRVFAMPVIGYDGAFTEYCIVKECHLAKAPISVDLVAAAALPLVSLTSWQAMFNAGQLEAGQRVLIHAGAGGVGHIAIQLAKAKGAVVITTTSEANAEFVAQLGADEIINYNEVDFETALANAKVDMVFDTLGGETQFRSLNVLKRAGKLVSITGLTPETEAKANILGISAEFVFVQANGEQLRQVAELVDTGQLTVNVAQTFSFEDITTAFDISAQGHVRGKLVMKI
ncbi:NADP-dependent oxidoreductase [Enterovibrio sp. ZSDZ42]|uniref:NADP-dependent oxidoreductase n=1 Tax=Enterovibrio gelatinilyticus TaxID=2899819 RepID=A0ABT5R0H6_9GAMM|nr:NADP-dependent oxidoreductase [Enterovibrio sp. ZSDZ42]MDD1793773.1 NADP-dependent oxidoreductase [Enterovibrio sp. ZSDZ42]